MEEKDRFGYWNLHGLPKDSYNDQSVLLLQDQKWEAYKQDANLDDSLTEELIMNRIQIYYWHGYLRPDQQKKLEDMGIYQEGSGYYINDMSPAGFVEKWQDNVLLLSPSNGRKEWLVGVTQYSSFDQR